MFPTDPSSTEASSAGASSAETPSTGTGVPEVDVHEARRRVEAGALLLDVREPDEWAEAHVDGARHVPLGDLDPARVPQDAPVVAMCRSGRRSGQAVQALLAAGHPDVVNLDGGVLAWQEAGLPLVTGGPPA